MFNGREPDESRVDLDLGVFDSVAARLSFLPTDRLALQVSAGYLREAWSDFPFPDQDPSTRVTASAIYHMPFRTTGIWATTLAAGTNHARARVSGGILDATTVASLLESRITFSDRHTLFARGEVGGMPAHHLHAHEIADAAVYAIALFGVHRAYDTQIKAARVSGVLQLLLAIGALAEVVRRFVFGSEPEAPLMVVVALAALTANVTCMWLLARHRHGGAHMKASWIFTTNDVIANVGVVVAAGLVRLTNSNVPDLAVAAVIALVVLNGAVRILRLK